MKTVHLDFAKQLKDLLELDVSALTESAYMVITELHLLMTATGFFIA